MVQQDILNFPFRNIYDPRSIHPSIISKCAACVTADVKSYRICIVQVPVQWQCVVSLVLIQWKLKRQTLQEAHTWSEWPCPWLLFWYRKLWYEAEGPWKALHIWQMSICHCLCKKICDYHFGTHLHYLIAFILLVPFPLQHHVLCGHVTFILFGCHKHPSTWQLMCSSFLLVLLLSSSPIWLGVGMKTSAK